MKEIKIKTPNANSIIHCGAGVFQTYASKIQGQCIIITDSNVHRLYGELLKETFPQVPVCVFQAGERSKNEKTLLRLLGKMVAHNLKRTATVIAFGGGVVGDMAGLCASLYMRGIHLVQIPTTLLSQVDSSVGGKTAIDFQGVKNVIGSFYQPELVLVDPLFLQTLPKRELRCGLGEIIKYGALNAEILEKLESSNDLYALSFLEEITYDCIAHKAEVVRQDEKETTGLRKTLNLGHTTGHAFELSYGRRSHGEYVLIGMHYELKMAVAEGICSKDYAMELDRLIAKVISKIPKYSDMSQKARLAEHDKKNSQSNNISMIVPKAKGQSKELILPLATYTEYIQKIVEGM